MKDRPSWDKSVHQREQNYYEEFNFFIENDHIPS